MSSILPIFRRTRRQWILLVIVFSPLLVTSILSLSLFFLPTPRYKLQNFFSYSLRPLYDHFTGPKTLVNNYFSEGLREELIRLEGEVRGDGLSQGQKSRKESEKRLKELETKVCGMHGWKVRDEKERKEMEVWDVTIINTELELLEVRMMEGRRGGIDRWVIAEGGVSFTGQPKPFTFLSHLQNTTFSKTNPTSSPFTPFLSQTLHLTHKGRALNQGESPFAVENEHRNAVTRLLAKAIRGKMKSLGRVLQEESTGGNNIDGDDGDLSPPTIPPLLIFSDTDELISPPTIHLLKLCDFRPVPLHIHLRSYLYSFEWELPPWTGGKELRGGVGSWRAQVHRWVEGRENGGGKGGRETRKGEDWDGKLKGYGDEDELMDMGRFGKDGFRGAGPMGVKDPTNVGGDTTDGKQGQQREEISKSRIGMTVNGDVEWNGTYYRHSKAADSMLADGGWHCSYCFRRLEEFRVKMEGFSHADRIGGDSSLLEPERIQQVICEGKDIFGMLPEAYTYKDLLDQMYPEPSRSGVNLPLHVLENAERFSFLLPGGCMRERES